jgi:antitoxin CptB
MTEAPRAGRAGAGGLADPAADPAADAAADAARARLAWRCRRGMRELDLLLLAWLERHYERADAQQRAQFAALLELPDPQLAACLLAGEPAAPAALQALVELIRTPLSGMGAG